MDINHHFQVKQLKSRGSSSASQPKYRQDTRHMRLMIFAPIKWTCMSAGIWKPPKSFVSQESCGFEFQSFTLDTKNSLKLWYSNLLRHLILFKVWISNCLRLFKIFQKFVNTFQKKPQETWEAAIHCIRRSISSISSLNKLSGVRALD